MANGANEVTAEHLADLKSTREAQLVRKFVSGRPLLELEMSELAHLIPAAALANPPPLRPEYRREIPEYAAEIGVHKRSVYRWVDAGVEARDPVPLDQPGQILAWWGRHMSRSAPEYLEKWAANSNPRGVGAPPAAVGSEIRPLGERPKSESSDDANGDDRKSIRQAIDITAMSGMGLEASVQLLRQTVEANAKLVAAALSNPDDNALTHYQTRFEKGVDQLRKAEEALFKFQKMRGDLAPKSEFRADLIWLLTGLRGMLRRRADNTTAAARKALEPLKLPAEIIAQILGAVHAASTVESARDEQLLRSTKTWKAAPSGEIIFPPPSSEAELAPINA